MPQVPSHCRIRKETFLGQWEASARMVSIGSNHNTGAVTFQVRGKIKGRWVQEPSIIVIRATTLPVSLQGLSRVGKPVLAGTLSNRSQLPNLHPLVSRHRGTLA